ncbi:MAG TPA: flagellar hook-length control protein FliK [Cryobacterium sp.]|nr:flagellar hook-length control protein FliK [Cryobacterium sp.]
MAGTAPLGLSAAARTSVTAVPLATVNPAETSAPTALPVPLGTPVTAATTAVAPHVVSGAAAPAAPPAALAGQMSRPLFTLVGAANGDHVMTISVSPDNLGPVTVQAHVRGEHIRVELFAPTDLARDALRAILPDLRRDLSVGGLNAQLSLSADARASDPSASRHAGSDARRDQQAGDGRATPGDLAADPRADLRADLRLSSLRAAGSHTIDVLA